MRHATVRRAAEYRDEQRNSVRWRDTRMVLARLAGMEYPGATCDLSAAGMQVGLVGAAPGVEGEVEVTVAFEDELVTLRGRVVYARLQGWGSTFGVHFGAARRFGLPLSRGAYAARGEP